MCTVLCNRILVCAMDLLRNNNKTAASFSNEISVEREEEEVEEEEGERKWKWKWKWKWKRRLEMKWNTS